MVDLCITCGEIVVEGRQVCPRCMAEATRIEPNNNVQDLKLVHELLTKASPRSAIIVAAMDLLSGVIQRMDGAK